MQKNPANPSGPSRRWTIWAPTLYRRFVALTSDGKSEVDLAPLRLVADSFTLGRRRLVEAFGD